jgi:ATP-dependent Lon protease
MTGELTLTGLVLPIGGLKQKAMAAHRAGVRKVICPAENRKDLEDIPESVREALEFVFVDRIEDVLAVALPELEERLRACRLDWEDPSDGPAEPRELAAVETTVEAGEPATAEVRDNGA